MSDNQDALRLADVLERPGYGWHSTPTQCAAHIRRLVAENEALQQKLRSTKATLQRGREVWKASTEAWNSDVAERDALLRQAVDAWDSDEIETDPVAEVIEAIRTYLTQRGATK